jgi:cytochrome c-type biogenesis protein CcmI
MGLITGLLTLPAAPLRGVIWMAEQLQQAAERELGEEGTRRRLAELQVARDTGEITPEEYAVAEAELIERLLRVSPQQEGRTHD